MRYLLLAALACLAPIIAAAQERSPAIPPSSMDQIALKLQGRRMQAAVDTIYHQMKSSNSLKPGPNDITFLVRKYIDLDINIRDTTSVLRNAGYTVDPLPPRSEPENPLPGYHNDDKFKIFAVRTVEKDFSFSAVSTIVVNPSRHELSDSVVNDIEAYISFSGI